MPEPYYILHSGGLDGYPLSAPSTFKLRVLWAPLVRRQYKSNLKVEFVLRLKLTYLTYKNEIESLVFPV